MQKTHSAKASQVKRQWLIIDASGRSVGRLASQAALLLRGKHKPEWTPHIDGGDFVIVINSDKAVLTGSKRTDKKYYRHSRYTGSLKERRAEDLKSEDLIVRAIQGMLPKNKLRARALKKLRVYAGSDHGHEAQNPKAL